MLSTLHGQSTYLRPPLTGACSAHAMVGENFLYVPAAAPGRSLLSRAMAELALAAPRGARPRHPIAELVSAGTSPWSPAPDLAELALAAPQGARPRRPIAELVGDGTSPWSPPPQPGGPLPRRPWPSSPVPPRRGARGRQKLTVFAPAAPWRTSLAPALPSSPAPHHGRARPRRPSRILPVLPRRRDRLHQHLAAPPRGISSCAAPWPEQRWPVAVK